eukprot:TRINITY_DN16812_c0_g1_i1.p1 TRINITY_DN16812_c0_g1~~TRINITY_DN16812_c0_g1_i1.p1  ORF type:complete len:237 (+),score=47.14 TRINITY_DN16812_c0_g1_i1:233-943(+)
MKAEQYKVCTDCGISHTPLWRGGPLGPKTMCNACGIRWKRANQAKHKLLSGENSKKHKLTSSKDSEDEFDITPESSDEELERIDETDSAPMEPQGSPIRGDTPQTCNVDGRLKGKENRHSTMTKRKLFASPRSKPYSKHAATSKSLQHALGILSFDTSCPDCAAEAAKSMNILKQAAEEIEHLDAMLSSQPDESIKIASYPGDVSEMTSKMPPSACFSWPSNGTGKTLSDRVEFHV